ncbi:hypothetical protein C463_17503 [Halorubrum californiense DSM 19288]|uniref:Uncharacterized protein n=1 Tax=Halorubrum californiense DSM 19288 TaxID=1227465 RepID=M0DUF1_9EURY|nr:MULTISPECIES: hypothetical protein [Halorubrum]ELZ39135.1 hypothetical protein C463_17503 [Halorubrum californiense DSM 19288]TKX71977.1 hypothetical protein EXE40_05700 [Halorubrum sp. GN11GM_10-3_MGM]
MNTDDGGHHDAAVDALAVREYERAGNRYTRGGRRVLADPRPEVDPFGPDEKGWIGQGLQQLLAATVAYRIAGADARAARRAAEGIAVTRDLESALRRPGQTACLGEFVADFRVGGGLDGAEEAYDDAATEYEAAGDEIDSPQALATTPLFEAAAATIKQVARGQDDGEIAIKWESLHGADPSRPGEFLAHRARFKKQRFRGLVDRAVDEGRLAAPRGTTEYNNDGHRCPNCGSNHVNWAGTGILCLRCSRPTESI